MFVLHRTGVCKRCTIVVLVMAAMIFSGTAVPPAAAADIGALHSLENQLTALVDSVLPSVVSITVKQTVAVQSPASPFDGFFDFPFPFSSPQRPQTPERRQAVSYGSGVIVRSDGYVLTNDHVVGKTDKVTVTLKDGREFEGKVFRDQKSDLAVVKIDAQGLPAARLADSGKVKPGHLSIAIGNPFGLNGTVTMGIVSAVGRSEGVSNGRESRFYPNLIQTDASINPGNSGGPLINMKGEVIGINTLIQSPAGGNIGIGFAIPSNTAKFVMDQLISGGKVTRGYLGLVPVDLTPKSAERYGVKDGVLVQSVETGSPADKAGVQVEDVIVEFAGKTITDAIGLRELIAAASPGSNITMVVVRGKARKSLSVKLEEAPGLESASVDNRTERFGFSISKITPQIAEQYKIARDTPGVVVTRVAPGSEAAAAGLAPGMIIIRVNNTVVRSEADFASATKGLSAGDTLRLVIRMKERTLLVEIPVEK